MSILFRLSAIFFLLQLTVGLSSQTQEGTALICGRILFEQDSIYPLKPYSIVIRKDWPITYKQFEQTNIDTTDYSFKVRMKLDQLTYGTVMVNFFKDLDSTTIERNGLRLSSELANVFFGGEYAARIIFSGLSVVIEPGDSLNIEIVYDELDQSGRPIVNFSGKGGANNKLARSRDFSKLYNRSFRLPLEEGLAKEDREMKSELKDLDLAKDSISMGYYSLLRTDILFNNLKTKHALIRASLYGSDIKLEEKRAKARAFYMYLDTLTLKSEYVKSRNFRSFLNFYLEYLNRIVTGKDISFGFNEKSYWLAKAVFEKDILKAFLYEQLAFQMEVPRFYPDQTIQYKDFIKRFPETPEAYRLEHIYNKHFPVTGGQPAPDLFLTDSTGKTKKLSSLKGKVVFISTSSALRKILSGDPKNQMDHLRSKFGDKNVVFISVNDRFSIGRYKYSPSIDYYVTEDSKNTHLPKYQYQSMSQYHFIIRKNGRIEDCVSSLNLSDQMISNLNSERYSVFTGLYDFLQGHLRGLLFILSFLFILILAFFINAKVKQRRQSLIKKQLNSELKAIRSQLNPHFLFNSLNSIQNFINTSDPKTANLHLSKFSLLMRRVIELSEKESITLKEELDFNKTFIELEQLRYGFKCKFDIEKTIDLYNVEIPGMIIQPFIENAIVHCMADLGKKGELGLAVTETPDKKICVQISDNGKGFQTGADKGFGLRSSRERIDLLNSQNREKIKLQIESSTTTQTKTGSTVTLIIPKKY